MTPEVSYSSMSSILVEFSGQLLTSDNYDDNEKKVVGGRNGAGLSRLRQSRGSQWDAWGCGRGSAVFISCPNGAVFFWFAVLGIESLLTKDSSKPTMLRG